MIYAAELSKRKNQSFLLDIFKELEKSTFDNILLIVGKGQMRESLQKKAENLGISKKVHFLGFRKDIPELLAVSDLCVSTSLQEGLPVNIIESLAMGIPVVASKIRGHIELIRNGENGFLCEPGQLDQFVKAISSIKKQNFSIKNKDYIQTFYLKSVSKEMQDIYKQYE
jgi:glycosyltransferase EpsD